jgi:putative solute:sodium symporter small subunit
MFAELSPLLASGNTGELFRQILPFAFVGIVVIMVLHLAIALVLRGSPADRKKWNIWDILIYLGTLGCVAVLAATSFVEVLRHGELGGWPLFFHMFGAGAFTAVLPLLALSWAHLNQFDVGPSTGATPPPKFNWLPKLMFWVILVSGLVVTMTMLLSMLPVFGSDGLRFLLDLHRYSGLIVVLALLLHFYGVAVQRLGLR